MMNEKSRTVHENGSKQNDQRYSERENLLTNYVAHDGGNSYPKNLVNRVLDFAVAIIQLVKTILHSQENNVIKHQSAKSGTSVGANYEEAQSIHSKAEFKYRISIVLKEIRESNYWLRLLLKLHFGDTTKVTVLINESYEVKKIFGSIYSTV